MADEVWTETARKLQEANMARFNLNEPITITGLARWCEQKEVCLGWLTDLAVRRGSEFTLENDDGRWTVTIIDGNGMIRSADFNEDSDVGLAARSLIMGRNGGPLRPGTYNSGAKTAPSNVVANDPDGRLYGGDIFVKLHTSDPGGDDRGVGATVRVDDLSGIKGWVPNESQDLGDLADKSEGEYPSGYTWRNDSDPEATVRIRPERRREDAAFPESDEGIRVEWEWDDVPPQEKGEG